MTDSICLAEFAGYNYTLDRGNGAELVLEIFDPSLRTKRNDRNSTGTQGVNATATQNVNVTAFDGVKETTSAAVRKNDSSYPYFLMVLISYRGDDEAGHKSIKAFNATYGGKIKGAPLIVANYGLHFKGYRKNEDEYRRRLKTFLHSVDTTFTSLNNTIIYRETSAQHFSQSRTGEYVIGAHNSPKPCAPLNFTDESFPMFDWKNVAVRSILHNSTAFPLNHRFEIVPFFNLTAALYDLHARDGTDGDCTHYCHAALRLIFAGVWSSILDIVRRI